MYNSFNINYFNDDKANRLYNPNSTICGIPHVFLYYYVSKKYPTVRSPATRDSWVAILPS